MIPDNLTPTIIEFQDKYKGWKFRVQTFRQSPSENVLETSVYVYLRDPSGKIFGNARAIVHSESTWLQVNDTILSLVVELISSFHVEQAKDHNQYALKKGAVLFDKYSANLSRMRRTGLIQISPSADDLFVCPLCLGVFERQDLNSNIITREHLPPDKLGGRVRTLTCKSCNNSHGSILDSALIEFTRDIAFLSGSSDVLKGGVLSKDDDTSPIVVNLTNLEDGVNVSPVPKASNPAHLEQINQAFQSPQDLLHLTLTLGAKPTLRDVALLRVAYLWGFSVFGYNFINHPNMTMIRKQINSPQATVLPSLGIWRENFPDSVLGINLLIDPKELRCFFVVFDVKIAKSKYRYGVMLPGPTKRGLEIYEAHKNIVDGQPIPFNVVKLDDEINLIHHHMESTDIWEAYCGYLD